MELFNGDCLEIMPTIETNSVDMVLVDLPYGQTACEWDSVIDLNKMWEELRRIGKDCCQYIFFCTTKFGYKLISSNPLWFRYDLVLEKPTAVGFLSAKHMPLRNHEMIYIFSNQVIHDLNIERNLEIREYAKKVLKFINKTSKQIERELKHRKAEHFLQRVSTTQFSLPTRETYNELIEKYKINEMEGFIQYDNLKFQKCSKVYNPQKTPGKPYKVKAHKIKKDVYGQIGLIDNENITGDRQPLSIQKFKRDKEKLHRTQKPVEACEWLIKTYSNEGDVVLDFTMGSGSTGVACKNTNRKFIGIEKDEEIFKIAEKRLADL
jgi:site-specific DNA-methyltransferase (adenine-specific)